MPQARANPDWQDFLELLEWVFVLLVLSLTLTNSFGCYLIQSKKSLEADDVFVTLTIRKLYVLTRSIKMITLYA